MSLPWRLFSVVPTAEPAWIYEVRAALAAVSDALPWVHRVQGAWQRERPLAADASPRRL